MRSQYLLTMVCITTLVLSPFIVGATYDDALSSATKNHLEGSFVPNEILIGLEPEAAQRLMGLNLPSTRTGIDSVDQLSAKYGVQQMAPIFADLEPSDSIAVKYGLAGIFKLTVPAGTDIFSMVAEYRADPNVAYAEPNRIYVATEIPNDTDFNKQWALNNTGQTGGKPDADIDAPEAWNIEKGKTTVMIAIVDTGVDYTHPDLAGGRVRTDIDKDFVNHDDIAMDDHGHGTYVAGIAAANTNNARGIAGVCRGCQILPVKVLNSEGSGTSDQVAQGIQYAANAGAKIISMSLGYPSNCGCSQTVASAINYAFEHGSLLIAASGNDSDKSRLSYPASSPRVLAVGATDYRDQEADFSNRSTDLDILAPGKDIYSLDRNGSYRTASGTSAATPHVSGVAGLLWSQRSTLSNAEVWSILYHSADDAPQTNSSMLEEPSVTATVPTQAPTDGPYKAYLPIVAVSRTIARTTVGRLNAYRALTVATGGQRSTPVDTCSGEPSCPPGCGAEVALTGQRAAVDDLHLLRVFRDRVLARSPLGLRWAALYEEHRVDVALILMTDDQLRAQARSALTLWLPLVQVLTDANSAQKAELTAKHIEAAEAVINGLTAKGDPELRQDLENAGELLNQARPLIGKDIREVWNALQTVGR